MRIRFVLCHPSHLLIEEEREIFLASALFKMGHDAAYFAISNRNLRQSRRQTGFACPVELFPADDPSESPHRTTSTALLQALCRDQPDIVMVKGVGYRQSAAIFETFARERLGVIIGGRGSHPLLDKASIVYFESQRQKDDYSGSALTTVLPKYIKWGELDAVEHCDKKFDVINIGNFNETRKSQEFLFPLAHRHRIAFVGGGSRLPSFKNIAQGNRNITFAGFLDRRTVFSWLKAAYLMVHTSIWDGYPRAVAESSGSRRPGAWRDRRSRWHRPGTVHPLRRRGESDGGRGPTPR